MYYDKTIFKYNQLSFYKATHGKVTFNNTLLETKCITIMVDDITNINKTNRFSAERQPSETGPSQI